MKTQSMFKGSLSRIISAVVWLMSGLLVGLPAAEMPKPPQSGQDQKGVLRIVVEPAHALFGEPFSLSVEGVRPGGEATVMAEATDRRGTRWQSKAVFLTGSGAVIDLSVQAPVSGDYQGADGLGLLWSMRSLDSESQRKRPFARDEVYGLTVMFSVTDSEGRNASATMRRYHQLPGQGLVRVPLEKNGMHGFLYHPIGKGPFPGIIILGGSNGGLYEWLARLFASNGFAALTLAYFKHRDLPQELLDIPLEYFRDATVWLRKQQCVRPDRIALVGGSKGGEAALLLASVFPDYRAVVAWVPAAHVWQGISMNPKPASSWSLEGKGLPYVHWIFSAEDMANYQKGKLDSFRFCYERGLENADPGAAERAAIPVEKINAPILLVSGTDDQTWPSAEFSRALVSRLEKNRYTHEFQHLSIEGGGHMVFLPTNVISGQNRAFNGGHPRADCHGVVKSWQATLEFLHRHLDR